MKKLKILSLIPALLLCACNNENRWIGTYQFRLGKSDGNHMEITAELTAKQDKKYKDYKVMNLTADLGDNMDPTSTFDDIEEAGEIIIPILEDLGIEIASEFPALMKVAKKELTNFKDIKLYYNVTDTKAEDGSYRLNIGTHELGDRLRRIRKEHPEIREIVDEAIDFASAAPFLDSDLNLSPKNSKYLFNVFVSRKGLNIQVPVSSDDVDMQLLWYGMNYPLIGTKILPDKYMKDMPGKKGDERFGTHPKRTIRNNVVIEDQVQEVNTIFAKEFSKSILYLNEDIESTELGRFVIVTKDNAKHLKFISNAAYSSPLEGYIKKEGSWTHLSLNVDASGDCGKIKGSGRKMEIQGTTETYLLKDFFSDPFEFRDFNNVDVGLGKVVL